MTISFNKNFLIGVELVRRKYITQDQLDEGLILHQRRHIRLGAALIELGYITDDDLAKVIADQLGIAYINFETLEVSNEVLQKVPRELIKSYNVFPVHYGSNELTVCVADPLDNKVRRVLSDYLGEKLKLAIASKAAIRKAIEKYYTF